MPNKKVLLVNLVSHEAPSFRKRAVLRAGLGYAAQALKGASCEVRAADLSLNHDMRWLMSEIRAFRPDFLGVTLFTYRYLDCYGMLAGIKEAFPQLAILCGGPHITTFREKALEECPAIDFGFIGESEESLAQFMAGSDPSKIQGLVYRSGEKVVSNGRAPNIENLDAIAFPRYEGFELADYPLPATPVNERVIPVVTSRGCPYDCIYCPVKTCIGQKFRYRSAANVLEELKYWYGLGYRRFSFVDDNFTLIRDRVEKLCEGINSAGLSNLVLSLPNGIRADKVDRDLLEKMFRCGFRFIGFGVESGNNEILKILKKHETIETIERAVKDACEIGFLVDMYFIIGSPHETEKEVRDSVNVTARHPIDNAFYFNLIPYPETELFEWAKANARFIYPPEYYLNKIQSNLNIPVFETPEFTARQRLKMLKYAKSFEQKRKSLVFERKLAARGVPSFIAAPVARLYSSKPVQRMINDSKFLNALKNKLVKHG